MRTEILLFSILIQALYALDLEVHDKNRSKFFQEDANVRIKLISFLFHFHMKLCAGCPSGYKYYGEVDVADVPTRDHWVEGPRSPTYSCYQRHHTAGDWVTANQK